MQLDETDFSLCCDRREAEVVPVGIALVFAVNLQAPSILDLLRLLLLHLLLQHPVSMDLERTDCTLSLLRRLPDISDMAQLSANSV